MKSKVLPKSCKEKKIKKVNYRGDTLIADIQPKLVLPTQL
jgi:hypothetical protein